MFSKVQNWLRSIDFEVVSVSTPIGGFELKDKPCNESVKSRDEAIREFVGQLLFLKEMGLTPTEKDHASKFVNGIGILSDYLRVHSALIPTGNWKLIIPKAINNIVEIQKRIQAGENPDSYITELVLAINEFLDVIDETLSELAEAEM